MVFSGLLVNCDCCGAGGVANHIKPDIQSLLYPAIADGYRGCCFMALLAKNGPSAGDDFLSSGELNGAADDHSKIRKVEKLCSSSGSCQVRPVIVTAWNCHQKILCLITGGVRRELVSSLDRLMGSSGDLAVGLKGETLK